MADFSTSGRDGDSSRAHSTPQLWKVPASGLGFGLIIRDWEGSILALMEDCFDQGPCPLFNQALGCLKALNFCRDTGFWLIDLDCEDNSLVSLIREGPTVLSELGHVIDEITVVLGSLQSVSCCHIFKNCNAPARGALAKGGPSVSFEDCPPCLQSLVSADLHH